MLGIDLIDDFLRARLGGRRRIQRIRLEQAFGGKNAPCHRIADLDRDLFDCRLVVAGTRRELQAQRTDAVAVDFVQRQSHPFTIGHGLNDGLPAVDDRHIVRFGRPSQTPDIGPNDGVVRPFGRCRLQGDQQQLRVPGQYLVDQFLGVALHGQEGRPGLRRLCSGAQQRYACRQGHRHFSLPHIGS